MTFISVPLLYLDAPKPLFASLRMQLQTPLWTSQAPLWTSRALLFRMCRRPYGLRGVFLYM